MQTREHSGLSGVNHGTAAQEKVKIGGLLARLSRDAFKQRVIGSNPTRLISPCGARASALFRNPLARRCTPKQRVSVEGRDDVISLGSQELKRLLPTGLPAREPPDPLIVHQ